MRDVAILAGGRGTRLRGLWNAPKCLVPIAGRPLIERLLELISPLAPAQVVLILGHGYKKVRPWLIDRRPDGLSLTSILEDEPRSTAHAVRTAFHYLSAGATLVRSETLVLNGDTLPRYDLGALVRNHEQRVGCWATAAMAKHQTSAWRKVYAGACVLSDEALADIVTDERTRDFQAHLVGAHQFDVPGFLDVGTPEGFKKAQSITEEELCKFRN